MTKTLTVILLLSLAAEARAGCGAYDSYDPDCRPSEYAESYQREHEMQRMQDDIRRMQQQRELEYRYGSDGGITRVH